MASSRDKYRNPSVPAPYIVNEKPGLKMKDDLMIVDGVVCQFIKPMIEVGFFERTWDEFEKFIINSDSEDEVLELPVEPKVYPVINLEEDDKEDISPKLETPEEQPTPTVEQVPGINKSQELQVENTEKKTKQPVSYTKNSQNDKVPARISPVEKGEIIRERCKFPVCKITSLKKISTRETSPKRKPLNKDYDIDENFHSRHSKYQIKKVSYARERHRSTSRERYRSTSKGRHRSTSREKRRSSSRERRIATSRERRRSISIEKSPKRTIIRDSSPKRTIIQDSSLKRNIIQDSSPKRNIIRESPAKRTVILRDSPLRESSPKRKPSKKEKYEGYGSDSSSHTHYSDSSVKIVEFKKKKRRSDTRERNIKRRGKCEDSLKREPSKREEYECYSDDGSSQSSYSKSLESYKRRSRSRSGSVEDKKVNIKNDPDDLNLFGRYHCADCNATMNSLETYETHQNGKRHLKNLKLKNVVKTVKQSFQPIQVESKYPPPPPGITRERVNEPSQIQHVIDTSLQNPCPGLENIIEIQGVAETTYYCDLCSAPCSTTSIIPHLQGYRHLLHCLKHFDFNMYTKVQDKKKFEVQKQIEDVLRKIERDRGRGYITVEREYQYGQMTTYPTLGIKSERGRRREDIPGPSHRDPEDSFPEHYQDTTIPDLSMSDFYCKICDSHMNNISSWEMHIRGKRHLSNVKKAPGQLPSKTKTILIPNARAKVMDDFEGVTTPIVGLSKMREVQNPDAPGELYNCFLCGACLVRRDVVDHVISLKHRKKYLEAIDHPEMFSINCMNMLDYLLGGVIEEICHKVEEKEGRGNMEVHMTKSGLPPGRRW